MGVCSLFCNKTCCSFMIILLVLLSAIGFQLYRDQDSQLLLFKTVVNKAFSTFPIGTICLQFPNRKSGENKFERYGLNASPNSKCSSTISITDEYTFYSVLAISGGNTGFGEAYVEGSWTPVNIDPVNKSDFDVFSESVFHFMNNALHRKAMFGMVMEYLLSFRHWMRNLERTLLTTHTSEEDQKSIEHHYDVGNDFYQSFLGPQLSGYSCGVYNNPNDSYLKAQDNKWDMIINKARIFDDSQKVVDIGCGWGYFPSYINNKTGAQTVGITVSTNQLSYMKSTYAQQVKDKKVAYMHMDYRDLPKKYGKHYFDRAVSIGMLEHVGYNRMDEYFQAIWDVLKPGSFFLLHYISRTDIHPYFKSVSRSSACSGSNFISTYIFPNGCVIYSDWVWEKADEVGFVKLHEEFFGKHYAKTLNKWRYNLEANWTGLIESRNNDGVYDDRLYKIYQFYLAYCEAVFRNGRAELVQQLFYKPDGNEYTPDWDHYLTYNPNL